ncbi:uncharacterized protein CIMG_13117 [Coccidioides immitis RS]|uniref:Uncharacterized protein n=1 Tax=Coccidioides immitis (strain RS) TaxID=246410 RepID=A0A0D8JWL6_COCIM|nr:uncharacterized protein CIMG_13117 [Coccidioides immitis RS]KJF60668.1 hypothetical protein CIMG_13117 [Coccidioides immitis RS]
MAFVSRYRGTGWQWQMETLRRWFLPVGGFNTKAMCCAPSLERPLKPDVTFARKDFSPLLFSIRMASYEGHRIDTCKNFNPGKSHGFQLTRLRNWFHPCAGKTI